MRRALLLLLAISAVAACKKKEPREIAVHAALEDAGVSIDSVTTEEGSTAEPGVDHGPRVAFRILHVHSGRTPSDAPPYHAPGGSWTFFDAETSDGKVFGFGYDDPQSVRGGEPTGAPTFGKVMLTVPDGGAGKRLVQTFARVFKGEVPPEVPARSLRPRPFSAAFLARGARRSPGGGFAGRGGGWTATKLFLQKDDLEAEVFFNFDLGQKKGEFSEKDASYATPMVAWLAAELRDGPAPRRTPESDPALVAKGPKITWVRSSAARMWSLSPERDRLWVTSATEAGGTQLTSVGFEREDDVTPLLAVPHRLGSVQCTSVACLVTDVHPRSPRVIASDDPATVLLVDRKKRTTTELTGGWGPHAMVPMVTPAEGSRFVVTAVEEQKNKEREQLLFVVEGTTVKGPVRLGSLPIEVLAIARDRVLVRRGSAWTVGKKTDHVAVDPTTLAITPASAPPESEGIRSPDGKRTASCRKDGAEIVLRGAGGERVFAVHPDDRRKIARGCVRWASPRWLEYRGATASGFFDAESLRITPWPEDAGGRREYDASFGWVVELTESGGHRIGRISAE